jgi:hypothetical protein
MPSIPEIRRDRNILVNYMLDRMDWTKSREIRRDTEVSPLRVRQVAQAYPKLLVSSTEGYKLVVNATRDEIVHNVQSLIERAEKITTRAGQLASQIK